MLPDPTGFSRFVPIFVNCLNTFAITVGKGLNDDQFLLSADWSYIQFQFSMIREQKTEKFGAWKLKRKIILAGLFFIAIPGVLFWASEIGNWQTLVEFLVKLRIFFIQSNNSEYCREHSRILRKQISSSLNWIMAKQRQTVGLGLQSKTKHTPGQQEIKHWTYMKTQSGNM